MFWKIFTVFMVLWLMVGFLVNRCRHCEEPEDKSDECPYE
jgi:hypothetical protein